MTNKITGKLIRQYKETEKAIFGRLQLSDGRYFDHIVIPKSQISDDGVVSDWILNQKIEEQSIEGFIDRFGRRVGPMTARIINNIAKGLKSVGFKESTKNPNLFYLRIHKNKLVGPVIVFADLRGTEIVPIEEDTRPLIWTKFDRNYRIESLQKDDFDTFILHNEGEVVWSKWNGYGPSPRDTDEYLSGLMMHILDLKGIPSRRTFDIFSVMSQDYEEYLGTLAAKEADAMREYNAYIGEFMKLAEEYSPKNLWKKCRICGIDGFSKYSSVESIMEWKNNLAKLEMHHVSYEPEVVIPVCKKCHTKIHHSEDYGHLKPEITRKEWLQSKKNK